jgi:replicative superfamily II helicase
LTIDEREIIENAYRANSIRVIVCTSTLSSGVIIKMIYNVTKAGHMRIGDSFLTNGG